VVGSTSMQDLFYELEGFVNMMSRGYAYVHVCCCNQMGQIGGNGTLGREGQEEGRGDSEVPRW
jgi:hypothetical protein